MRPSTAWRSVAEALADEDLMGIADGNPDPVDEYRPEAESIVQRMHEDPDASVSKIVVDVFEHWFEERFPQEDGDRVADRIEQLSARRDAASS